MTDKNRDQVQAFSNKMKHEGAAGFAAGLTPWDSWDDFEDRVGSRVLQGSAEHVTEQEVSARSFGDRILTTMTALAVATLVIGIAGVFFTQNDTLQIADHQLQIPAITTKIQEPPQTLSAEISEQELALNNPSVPATENPVLPVIIALNETPETTVAIEAVAETSTEQTINSSVNNPVTPEPDTNEQSITAALDDLPATAAGLKPVSEHPADILINNVSTTLESDTGIQPNTVSLSEEPGSAVSVAAPAPAPEAVMQTVSSEIQNAPDTKIVEADSGAPTQLAHADMLNVHTELQQQPVLNAPEIQQRINNGGLWSINLASYLKSATAEEMKQQFLDQGVAADLVTATVRGKTYYRLRVSGIETRDMAVMQSTTIKQQLGLKETWVTKE